MSLATANLKVACVLCKLRVLCVLHPCMRVCTHACRMSQVISLYLCVLSIITKLSPHVLLHKHKHIFTVCSRYLSLCSCHFSLVLFVHQKGSCFSVKPLALGWLVSDCGLSL